MSWDIFIQDIPDDITCVDDIPDDFTPSPIGKRKDLIGKIQKDIPEANFSCSNWGNINELKYSIEINIDDNEECYSIALHIRGDEHEATAMVRRILLSLGLKAFDSKSSTGLFKTETE